MPEANPTPDQEWNHFTKALAECLGDLDGREYLIISSRAVNHYVQFAVDRDGSIRAEAAANQYIWELQGLLTVEDYQTMERLGWSRPTNYPPELKDPRNVPGGSPNFFIDVEAPVDYQKVATLAVTTLRTVYGIGRPAELNYKAFGQNRVSVRFPTLGLERVRSRRGPHRAA